MTEQTPDQPDEQFRRDRHEHGGAPDRINDDQLARLTEEERGEAGIDAFDPDEGPPATHAPPPPALTQSEECQEEQAEIRREEDEGELRPIPERHPYPPTRYDRS